MRKPAILITGANGEMGRELIKSLGSDGTQIITLDLQQIKGPISEMIDKQVVGSILDIELLKKLSIKHTFSTIYHLAAILSTQAEKNLQLAHSVNVEGTLNLLKLALEQGEKQKTNINFFFPSSIAVYGFNNSNEKKLAGQIRENNYLNPKTIYGCNKLYCENIGSYFQTKYKNIDFRSIRFPGIISSQTIPNGGTSDYIPEMIHFAAKGDEYKCFARKDAQLPFITMVDAIRAIHGLLLAEKQQLKQNVYNIRSFAPTAEEFKKKILKEFKNVKIFFKVNKKRQSMIDSWPGDTNDNAAKSDWQWSPRHDLDLGLCDYLIPEIKKLYS